MIPPKEILKVAFLHVAIGPCDELYEHKSLLSKNPLAHKSHEIVHPSYADNAANAVIGKVIESFFGNYGINETGIDAAFIQTNQRNLGGTCISFFLTFYNENLTQVYGIFNQLFLIYI